MMANPKAIKITKKTTTGGVFQYGDNGSHLIVRKSAWKVLSERSRGIEGATVDIADMLKNKLNVSVTGIRLGGWRDVFDVLREVVDDLVIERDGYKRKSQNLENAIIAHQATCRDLIPGTLTTGEALSVWITSNEVLWDLTINAPQRAAIQKGDGT